MEKREKEIHYRKGLGQLGKTANAFRPCRDWFSCTHTTSQSLLLTQMDIIINRSHGYKNQTETVSMSTFLRTSKDRVYEFPNHLPTCQSWVTDHLFLFPWGSPSIRGWSMGEGSPAVPLV